MITELPYTRPVMRPVSRPSPNPFHQVHALLEEYGWVQNRPGDYITGFCLVGAIEAAARIEAVTRGADHWTRLHEINRTLGNIMPPDRLFDRLATWILRRQAGSIPAWNDKPWRRKRQVLELVDRAAAEWDRTHQGV